MDLQTDERSSESPLVERVWSSHSEQAGEFISIAVNHSELVITKRRGTLRITLRRARNQSDQSLRTGRCRVHGGHL